MFPNRLNRNKWGILLLLIHLVGVCGLLYPVSKSLFLALVPMDLLFAAVLLFGGHKEWNAAFVQRAFFIALFGWLVEVVGVSTGFPFGHYAYGNVLGFKPAGVPLLIGLNWLTLVYAAGVVFAGFTWHWSIKSLAVAAFITVFDVLMEPVAIALGFWHWLNETGDIPMQNYAAWFVISWLMAAFFYTGKFNKTNPMAYWFFGSQVVFFALLTLLGV